MTAQSTENYMKFQVSVYEVHRIAVDVDAHDEDEAKDIVQNMMVSGYELPDAEYDYTMSSYDWLVRQSV